MLSYSLIPNLHSQNLVLRAASFPVSTSTCSLIPNFHSQSPFPSLIPGIDPHYVNTITVREATYENPLSPSSQSAEASGRATGCDHPDQQRGRAVQVVSLQLPPAGDHPALAGALPAAVQHRLPLAAGREEADGRGIPGAERREHPGRGEASAVIQFCATHAQYDIGILVRRVVGSQNP